MIKLYNGDCLIENKNIENGSVDLILTDLPYGTMNGINGITWDFAIDPAKVFEIANRILRKNGKMVLFSQEPYTTKLITKAIPNVPFNYRAIWEKDNFANGLAANKAMVGYFEDILIFSKTYDMENLHPLRPYFKQMRKYIKATTAELYKELGNQMASHYFTNGMQFMIPTIKDYNKLIEAFKINEMPDFKTYEELKKIDNNFKNNFPSTFNLWQGGKYKSNILKYKKDYNGYHPTQKPIALLEDLIKTFSNEGDLVVDLTMGSGSTGVACVDTNRNFIGIELGKNYFKIAEKRITRAKNSISLDLFGTGDDVKKDKIYIQGSLFND